MSSRTPNLHDKTTRKCKAGVRTFDILGPSIKAIRCGMASSGPAPLHGDENRQGAMLGTTITVTSLTTLVVILRMVTRIRLVRNVGWDDYTIVAACLGHIVALGLVVMELHYGFGRHRYYLTQRQFTEFMKYSYGEWIQTFQTLMFTKISICILLLRIPVEKFIVRPLQGAIAFLIVTNVVLTLLWIFQCNAIAGSWDKMRPAKCFTDAQLQRIIISQAIISIISDFVLALFPIVSECSGYGWTRRCAGDHT